MEGTVKSFKKKIQYIKQCLKSESGGAEINSTMLIFLIISVFSITIMGGYFIKNEIQLIANDVKIIYESVGLVNVISISLGIIGISISIYQYVKSLHDSTFFVRINTNSIIFDSPSISELKLTAQGIELKELSISTITFWNGGMKSINKSDISERNPIRIMFSTNCNILYSKVLISNNQDSNITIDRFEENSIKLHFDYLKMNNGAKIEVWHTGNFSNILHTEGIFISNIRVDEFSDKSNLVYNYKFKVNMKALIPLLLALPFISILISSNIRLQSAFQRNIGISIIILIVTASWAFIWHFYKKAVPMDLL